MSNHHGSSGRGFKERGIKLDVQQSRSLSFYACAQDRRVYKISLWKEDFRRQDRPVKKQCSFKLIYASRQRYLRGFEIVIPNSIRSGVFLQFL